MSKDSVGLPFNGKTRMVADQRAPSRHVSARVMVDGMIVGFSQKDGEKPVGTVPFVDGPT